MLRCLREWWNRKFLQHDVLLALFVWASGLGCWFYFVNLPIESACKLIGCVQAEFFKTLSGMALSILGFSMASISFLHSVFGRTDSAKLYEPLLKSPHINDLWNTFFSTIRWSGIGFVLSLIGWLNPDGAPLLFAFVLLVALVICVRVFRAVCFLKMIVLTKPSHLDN